MTREEVYEKTYRILREIGVPPATRANIAIAEITFQYKKNPSAIYGQWCSQLLPEAAAYIGSTAGALARLIGSTLEACRTADNGKKLKQVLRLHPDVDMPYPKEFICLLAGVIK